MSHEKELQASRVYGRIQTTSLTSHAPSLIMDTSSTLINPSAASTAYSEATITALGLPPPRLPDLSFNPTWPTIPFDPNVSPPRPLNYVPTRLTLVMALFASPVDHAVMRYHLFKDPNDSCLPPCFLLTLLPMPRNLAAFQTLVTSVPVEKINILVPKRDTIISALETPNVAPLAGSRYLHLACRFGCVEAVKILLQAGAHPSLADGNGCTPLHVVAMAANIDDEMVKEVVKLLCDAGATIDRAVQPQSRLFGRRKSGVKFVGLTPLQIAVRVDNFAAVVALTSCDAWKDTLPNDSGDVLLCALREANFELVTALSENTDLVKNTLDSRGGSVLHFIASGTCASGTRKRSLAEISGDPASEDLEARFLQMFLAKGLSVNEKDAQGMTPLHRLAEYRDASSRTIEQMIDLLLDHNADLQAKCEAANGEAGKTPFGMALLLMNLNVYECLLSAYNSRNGEPSSVVGD